jgi:hypothetical protein
MLVLNAVDLEELDRFLMDNCRGREVMAMKQWVAAKQQQKTQQTQAAPEQSEADAAPPKGSNGTRYDAAEAH